MRHTYLFNLLLAIALAIALIALFVGGPYLVTAQSPGGDLSAQTALGPAFTYQGFLSQSGTAVDGQDQCDMEFGLWDAVTSGSQLGITQTVTMVDFSSGYFTVELNGGAEFGANAFSGEARWLAITVRCPAGSGSYTSLGRQALTAAPYAHYSLSTHALQGQAVTSTVPISGQVLKYNGSQWGPGTDETGAGGLDPANIIIVAKSGGDYTSIQTALNSITDASASNPYLVRVAPGVYTEQVTMEQYVDIEGSGEGVTIIRYTGSNTVPPTDSSSATVIGANNAELRFLSVESDATGQDYATAIYNNGTSPALIHLTVSASGGATINIGVGNYSAASPMMNDITVSASGGGATINVGVGNYSSASPRMNDVTTSASGGDYSYGVYNSSASPRMNDVTASASGGTHNFGVVNESASPRMNNVTVSAWGGTDSYGVFNYTSASPTIENSSLTGNTNSIWSEGTSSVDVAHSVISGTVAAGGGLTCSDVTDGSTGDLLDTTCSGGSSGQVLQTDGSGNVTWQSIPPQNVIWVAKSGGDFTSVQAALDSISDASAGNPYLVMVAPGVYTERVTMKPYVDIEGSGEGVTKITSTGGSSLDGSSATLIGANYAELRFLTVENTGGGSYAAFGIYNNGAAPRLIHVTATASGASTDNCGVWNNASSSPMMNEVTAIALGGYSGVGVWNSSSSPTMNNVTATASGSTLNNGVYNGGGSPTMNNVTVTATASGGSSTNYGVTNDGSSPMMNNVTVTASGSWGNIGVYNRTGGSPTMINVTVTASGGSSYNYGVDNGTASPTTIHHSVISGSTYSIFNEYGTANVAASQLLGPITGTGFSCVGAYNSSFVALNTSCQ